MGFAGVILLPIDMAESYSNSDRSPVLEGFWAFVYWTTFLFTWIVLPFFQVTLVFLAVSQLFHHDTKVCTCDSGVFGCRAVQHQGQVD